MSSSWSSIISAIQVLDASSPSASRVSSTLGTPASYRFQVLEVPPASTIITATSSPACRPATTISKADSWPSA